jgi:hypothetical protein
MLSGGDSPFGGGFAPEGMVGEETGDELRVQGVAGLMGRNESLEGPTDKREVADQIERLVAAELIGETQRRVHDGVARKDDGVFE